LGMIVRARIHGYRTCAEGTEGGYGPSALNLLGIRGSLTGGARYRREMYRGVNSPNGDYCADGAYGRLSHTHTRKSGGTVSI